MGNSQTRLKQPEKTKNYIFAKERSIFDVTDDEINEKYLSSKSESEIAARAAKDSENKLKEFQAKLRSDIESRDDIVTIVGEQDMKVQTDVQVVKKQDTINSDDQSKSECPSSNYKEDIYNNVTKEVIVASKRTRKRLSEIKSPRGRSQSKGAGKGRGIAKVAPLNLDDIQQEESNMEDTPWFLKETNDNVQSEDDDNSTRSSLSSNNSTRSPRSPRNSRTFRTSRSESTSSEFKKERKSKIEKQPEDLSIWEYKEPVSPLTRRYRTASELQEEGKVIGEISSSTSEDKKLKSPRELLLEARTAPNVERSMDGNLSIFANKNNEDSKASRIPWIMTIGSNINKTIVDGNTKIKDFNIIRCIGTGLTSDVFIARHKKTELCCTIKRIKKTYVFKNNTGARFLSEKDVLRQLVHPFIMSIFGTFQDNNNIYFALEYQYGGELVRRIATELLSLEATKFYLCEILLAIEHIHKKGYIHRDLNLSNICLDHYGHVKIIDFGFAKKLGPTGKCQTICGNTLGYKAPELLHPDTDEGSSGYTKVIDWWSFACLAFELMNGKLPFSDANEEEDEPEYDITRGLIDVLTLGLASAGSGAYYHGKRTKAQREYRLYLKILKEKMNKFDKTNCRNRHFQDLIQQMLKLRPEERLADPELIREHVFFAGVDWTAVYRKQYVPPFLPTMPRKVGDAHYYLMYPEVDSAIDVPTPAEWSKTLSGF